MFGRGLFLSAIVVGLDQLAKWFIRTEVMNPPHVIRVTPFFDLVLSWNRGISFGLFGDVLSDGRWFFAGFSVVVTLALLFWLKKVDRPALMCAIAFVIGGAVGNIIDRVRFGAVVDFLYFHIEDHYFPAFNLADSAITIGVGLLLIDSLFAEPRSRK
ncbi:MAG: signal peptidase II [Alphaproteobacteria bacterium]